MGDDLKPLPIIACVCQGDKYGDAYVHNLRAGVARHLPVPHEFLCYTDRPIAGVDCAPLTEGLPGWWAKLELLKQRKPLLYFDLDVVILGDLRPALAWEGFGIIQDWWQPTFNSSVMRLTGDEYHVWEKFQPRFMQMVQGDQDFITGVMPDAKTFPPEWFPSFKASNCYDAPPSDAMACIFHGFPKPHQIGGWVAEQWSTETT